MSLRRCVFFMWGLALTGCANQPVSAPPLAPGAYERMTVVTYERSGAATTAPGTLDPNLPPKSTVPAAAAAEVSDGLVVCRPYSPPAAREQPPVPEFTVEESADPDRLALRLEVYINSLRSYIRQRAQDEDNAFLNYQKSCRTTKPTHESR